MTSYYDLTTVDLLIAAALVLINGVVSVVLRLRLERQLLIASVRTVVQLLLIGWLLRWVFARQRWTEVLLLMALMSTVAGIAAVRRTKRRFSGIWPIGLAAVAGSAWVVTGIALAAVIDSQFVHSHPAQYAVPLLGMVLGNTLTGISLGLDRLTGGLVSERDAVELRLSLGATRWEAALPMIQDAVRTGMIPIINSMMVVGIVSLPGMMTGQILAGVKDPMSAVRYQIVIMFLIAAAVALGVTGVTLLSYRRLFNARHQFLPERIRSVK